MTRFTKNSVVLALIAGFFLFGSVNLASAKGGSHGGGHGSHGSHKSGSKIHKASHKKTGKKTGKKNDNKQAKHHRHHHRHHGGFGYGASDYLPAYGAVELDGDDDDAIGEVVMVPAYETCE